MTPPTHAPADAHHPHAPAPETLRARASGVLTRRRLLRIALLALVATGLALLGSPQITQPVDRYVEGEFAARSVRAPYDLSITDEQATEQQRATTARNAPVVVSLDTSVPGVLRARFAGAWGPVQPVLAGLAALPAARPGPQANATRQARAARAAEETRQRQRAEARERDLAVAFDEVERRLGHTLPADVRRALAAPDALTVTLDGFGLLLAEAYRTPLVSAAGALAQLAPDGRPAGAPLEAVLVDTTTGEETRVADASRLREVAAAQRALETRADEWLPGVPAPVRPWLAALAARSLRPNALPDAAATKARRDAAADAVLPVSISFRRNQLIVGEGQPVTRQALLVLDAIRHQRMDRSTWQRMAGRAGVVFALLLIAFVVVDRERVRFAIETHQFTYALTSLAGTALGFRVWLEAVNSMADRYPALPESALVLAFPAAATVMHARVVLPYASAVSYLAVQAICLGLLYQLDLLLVIHLLVSGLVTGHLAAQCSRRQCVVQAGLVAGIPVAVVAACLALLTGEASGGTLAWTIAGAVSGCALSGLALLAVGPLFEWMFGHMTRIRLVELMNYQHPLLRRLTEVTPGTFQHSVTIGLLVDAAAQAVDADALLARVGALYHDAGKTERPEFFVENQHDANLHDGLAARESARLIIEHVPAGVRLVRQFGLGERIADFVREHHGTSTVRYFEAKALEAGEPADPADFRYPGPRPRSRETGILMIADQVEATARSMDAPSETELRAMVQRTIDRVEAEGQLDECPLTIQELAAIREAFVAVLVGVHHRRIKYPGQGAAGLRRNPAPATRA